MSTTTQFTTAPVFDSSIGYDRTAQNYAVYIDNELVGFAATYREAEQIRTQALAARGGSVWSGSPAPTVVRSPALDTAYALADELFA